MSFLDFVRGLDFLKGAPTGGEPVYQLPDALPVAPAGPVAGQSAAAISTRLSLLLAGIVNADGTTQAGKGFASAKSATGSYTVVYTVPITSGTPLLLAVLSSGTTGMIDVSAGGTGSAVYTYNAAGAAADRAFAFLLLTIQ